MAPLAITKASIRDALLELDFSDQAAKDGFLNTLKDACVTAKDSVSASALSEQQLIDIFFTNGLVFKFGVPKVEYPHWEERAAVCDTAAYLWTIDALDKVGKTWDIQFNESTCRVFLEVLITGCLWHLQLIQTVDTSLPHVHDFQTVRHHLKAFGEVTLKHTVHANRTYTLSGRADFAIGYGNTGNGKKSPALNTYLTLVETKQSSTYSEGWPQLLAYMGMVHKSRIAAGKKNRTVYGICSDGIRYTFARVDNRGLLWRSRELNIVSDVADIYSYILHIFKASELSSPSSSPTKREAQMRQEVDYFDVEVESKYFRFMSGGLFEEVEDEEAEDLAMI